MSFPYAKRYAGGFNDLPTQDTAIDKTFLNAVEAALIALMNDIPAANEVPVYDSVSGKFVAQKVTESQVTLADVATLDVSTTKHGLVPKAPNDTSKFFRGDAAWTTLVPKITTSTMAGGPPGSPVDGEVWIATAVDASGARWMFQYNSGSGSSYKWEFIGGAPIYLVNNPNQLVNAGVVVSSPNWWYPTGMAFTAPRAGDYEIAGSVSFAANGSADTYLQVSPFFNTTLQGALADNPPTFALDSSHTVPGQPTVLQTVPAAAVLGYAGATGNSAVVKFGTCTLVVRPKRIA